MNCECNDNSNRVKPRIKHVYGNVLRIAIPLTLRTLVKDDDEMIVNDTDFIPSSDHLVRVVFSKGKTNYPIVATMDGNVAIIEDKGKIPVGTYDISVECYDDLGNPYRFKQNAVLYVTDTTADAGIDEEIEYEAQTWYLNAAVFLATTEIGEIGDVIDAKLDDVFGNVLYDANAKEIRFYNKSNSRVLATIDSRPFIVDGTVADVYIDVSRQVFVVVLNEDAGGRRFSVPLYLVFNSYYKKDEVDSRISSSLENYYTKAQTDTMVSRITPYEVTFTIGNNSNIVCDHTIANIYQNYTNHKPIIAKYGESVGTLVYIKGGENPEAAFLFGDRYDSPYLLRNSVSGWGKEELGADIEVEPWPSIESDKPVASDGVAAALAQKVSSVTINGTTKTPDEDGDVSFTVEGGSGGYEPPVGGIPKTDLAQSVQDTLDDVSNKVDKVAGKGLSTEDYTTAEKTKLGNLPTADQLTQQLGGKANDNAVIKSISVNGGTPQTPTNGNVNIQVQTGSTISPATAAPLEDGTASVGSSAKYAREDHVHPHDTSKQDKLTSSTTLMTINGDDIHFGDSVTVEGEQGPQGQKGNSVVDGDSFEIVNNLTEGGDADALSADMGIVLKRNIGILNNNMQAMMTALANLAFSNARPTLAQLDWTTLTHSVTLVTTGLSHCSASADAKVAHGGNLVITLSPNSGYVLDGVTPTVIASSGTVSTAVSGDNILITVANVTADVTVTISATAVTAPLQLSLDLSHCSCSSHTDGQTITQGSTISVVLNADTNYTLSQNDIAVTGGTAQVTISNNGATAAIAIVVSGNVTVSAEAVSSLAYVSDGLVFHLDGTDTGSSNENEWVDKIGGIVFKKPAGSVITKLLNSNNEQIGWNVPSSGDGRYFAVMDGDTWNNTTDGSKVMTNLVTENGKTHFIIGTASGSPIGTSAVTIEAVFKQGASGKYFVCMFSAQSSSAASANAPYMVQDSNNIFMGLVSKFWAHTVSTSKQTVSMSTSRAYVNGNSLSTGTTPSKKNSTNEGGVFIGATRGTGLSAPSNQAEANLYAIRIYNKVLTENEVLHNQYVDDVLYGLGLNLTDVSLNNG